MKDNRYSGFTLIELILVLVVVVPVVYFLYPWVKNTFFIEEDSTAIITGGIENVITGSYKPPFIPVTISFSTENIVQVKAGGSIITPLGNFALEWEKKKIYYLEITLGNQTRFYPLGNNKFKVYIPNTLEGNISIRYDGEGNVRILVPKPGLLRFSA
jgi:hypothetical protein